MKIKTFLYRHQIILSLALLSTGIFLLVLGLLDIVLSKYAPSSITFITEKVGNWTYWFLVLGGFIVLIFGWFLFDRYMKIKEFNELIETPSKSKFIKNIARIETLALSLGPQYEERVTEKEDEYNIKR